MRFKNRTDCYPVVSGKTMAVGMFLIIFSHSDVVIVDTQSLESFCLCVCIPLVVGSVLFEPRCQKTSLWGIRPGATHKSACTVTEAG